MRCDEVIAVLKELAPEQLACDWDNPGLLAGRSDKEVKTIYLALDATDQVIEDAVSAGADLLVTHHPLIFKAMKKINDQDFIGRRVLRMIQADLSCYAMHTNFDSAPGCMADLAAGRLGLTECQVLEPEGELEGSVYGIGKAGKLGLPFVLVYGDLESDLLLTDCAVSPGSGGSMIEAALGLKAQVLVTGDIGHHQGIDSLARGMAVIDAGHYGLEHIFMDFMESYLNERLGGRVKIRKAPAAFPAAVV